MCLLNLNEGKMDSRESTLKRLHFAFMKQNAYYQDQAMKSLTADEKERYIRMRNACVFYIKGSRALFAAKPEVFAMAVGILDVFFWKVKVTEKHMSIVSAACFLLACKVMEEDESCPSPRQLSSLPFNSWTANDLCRMEMHILKKLDWTLSTVTYLDFLPLLADLCGVNRNVVCSDSVIALAERFITLQSTVLYQPLVLAMSLFQHTTDQVLSKHPEPSESDFTNSHIKYSEMLECKKTLIDLSAPNKAFPHLQVPRRSVSFPSKVFDKPSEIGSTCLPTINEE